MMITQNDNSQDKEEVHQQNKDTIKDIGKEIGLGGVR